MKSISKKTVCVLMLLILFFPAVTFSAGNFEDFSGLNNTARENYDLSKTDVAATIGNVISYIFSFLGVMLICIILISYFIMSSAGGDEEKVIKAKKWLKNGIIAILILMAAYMLAMIFVKFFSYGVFEPGGTSLKDNYSYYA